MGRFTIPPSKSMPLVSAEPMTEIESADLDAMVDDAQPVVWSAAVQTPATVAVVKGPASQAPTPPLTTAALPCEFCGANPKVEVKGFDCGCMRRQTVEGKLVSARFKEAVAAAAAQAAAEKAKA